LSDFNRGSAFALTASLAAFVSVAQAQSLYVTDYGAEQVVRYDIHTGANQGAFTSGYGFSSPSGLAFGPGGVLYASDLDNYEIAQFDGGSGAYVRTVTSDAGGNSLAVGADGTIYNVDSYAVLDASGHVIDPFRGHLLGYDSVTGILKSDYKGEVGGAFYDLQFGPDHNLYVTDNIKKQVYSFDGQTGASRGVFTSGGDLQDPFGLGFGPDGNLYVTSRTNHEILRYDGTTGVYQGIFASGDGLNFPDWSIFGPDGNLYVTDFGANQISRFNGVTGAYDQFADGAVGPIAFAPVPEPSTLICLACLLAPLLRRRCGGGLLSRRPAAKGERE
jgi:sugar lactone lactonase YvrE